MGNYNNNDGCSSCGCIIIVVITIIYLMIGGIKACVNDHEGLFYDIYRGASKVSYLSDVHPKGDNLYQQQYVPLQETTKKHVNNTWNQEEKQTPQIQTLNDSCYNVFKHNEEVEVIICPVCHGKGGYYKLFTDPMDNTKMPWKEYVECEHCMGKGKVKRITYPTDIGFPIEVDEGIDE